MRVIMKNDYFEIDAAREQALRKGRETEFLYVENLVRKFHKISNDSVFYPKNMFEKDKNYQLYFFLEEEVITGEFILDEKREELATITRMKYKNIDEVKLSYLDKGEPNDAFPNKLEIVFNTGKTIELNSIVDGNGEKLHSFINKIERIYSIL
ncbi:DUF3908 family protein [Bacillus wiedmannii]|uniref:DUF3908 family protein n=1 Tax=Bacillus wiedmannii TaxID=1890302 RepID=A0AA95LXF3_9BACI|nr:DUF3908 family protein [Bacillus wiedmannii]WHY31635.1 DUF3908 family protein [Bacillus wiedmannii]